MTAKNTIKYKLQILIFVVNSQKVNALKMNLFIFIQQNFPSYNNRVHSSHLLINDIVVEANHSGIPCKKLVDAIRAEHPQKVIALDSLFEGNDQLKTNTALQLRDAGAEFRKI